MWIDGIEYFFVNSNSADKHYTVTNCDKGKVYVDIPDKIDSIPITEISVGAFDSCSKLKSIKLNENIEKISTNAFFDCSSLKTITIPKKVRSVSWGTFSGCENLVNVIFEGKLSYLSLGSFSDCKQLKKVEFKNGITGVIGEHTFCHCPSLEEVIIYNKVNLKHISNSIFIKCEKLKKVVYNYKGCPDVKALKDIDRINEDIKNQQKIENGKEVV